MKLQPQLKLKGNLNNLKLQEIVCFQNGNATSTETEVPSQELQMARHQTNRNENATSAEPQMKSQEPQTVRDHWNSYEQYR